jgi:hypothetical protein
MEEKGNTITFKIMAIIFIIYLITNTSDLIVGDEQKITKKIESMHGEVLNIEERSLDDYRDKRRYYVFEYKIDNEIKTGSVIFGSMWVKTWKF